MAKYRPLKIHSSIKAMKKLAKILRINFLKTLKMNQRLIAPLGVFIWEKELNLSKNREHSSILT